MSFLRIIPVVVVLFFAAACGNNNSEKGKEQKSDSLPDTLAMLSKKIAESSENAALYEQRALYYLNHGDIEKALNDAGKATILDPKNSSYLRTLSDVFFAGGKITKCQEMLEKACEINPSDDEALLKLAELHFYKEEYKIAFEYTEKALKIDKLNAKADFIRGMMYKDMGDTAKAVRCFQIAVEKDQDYYHAYMQLGIIYSTKNNPLAADYFNNALNLNPKSIEALYALAMFYQNTGEYNKAIEKYSTILQINPKYKFAHYNLGYIHLVYLQVYNQAIKHFTDAISCDPNYAEAYYNRGYCYELLGNIQAARIDYQQSLKIKVNYQKAIDGMNRLDKLMNM
ncbi:MAG: tetratricopeptide repeat protein [Bacteroidales bacterium]|jgi:tetratricopeptide (TPR) repeat protein|nr:tetratricopeptide repeat protein [Bacteroidales bacterium]MDD4213680.1 tetratricopeptide repeat protein [Bacteroidales bacterium]